MAKKKKVNKGGFKKGHAPWNKGLKTKKVEEIQLTHPAPEPMLSPTELAEQPYQAKRLGFFERLFGWFK